MNDLNSMINKWKKISKEKANLLKKRNNRKYGIKNRKRPGIKENDNSDIEKIGE